MSNPECIQIIKEKFCEAKSRNPNLSLRAFSKIVKINVTSLSLALNGKRRLSKTVLRVAADQLNLTPRERSVFGQSESKLSENVLNLKDDEFRTIADWYHLAILNLASNSNIRLTVAQIPRRLNISPEVATESVNRLERLKLLTSTGGILQRTCETIAAGNLGSSAAVKSHHLQKLELAKSALTLPLELRDFGSTTFAFNHKEMPAFHRDLQSFRRKMESKYKDNSSEEIYSLCVQFFPLTNGVKDNVY